MLVTGHIIDINSGACRARADYVVKKSKTPVLTTDEGSRLLSTTFQLEKRPIKTA
jgi:hypothetical protein